MTTSTPPIALVRYQPNFESRYVTPRQVDIALPDGYDPNGSVRYPVIYMHDGQNLFSPTTAYGGVDWGVVPALSRLVQVGQTRAALIVGIWNTPQRWPEYTPQRFWGAPPAEPFRAPFLEHADTPPVSDNYLRFLVMELKPFVDAHFLTLPGRSDTFVMGSSMGGLISLYALSEYPEVFGGAACLSTHWVVGGDPLVDYCGAAIPRPGQHRLYFDHGTAALDADYPLFQQRMDQWMRAAGYRAGEDWQTLVFPGAEHNEQAWRDRIHLPLQFLLR